MDLDRLEPRLIANAALLDLWERSENSATPHKARALLAVGYNSPPESLDPLPLGAWNRALLRLRQIQFGSILPLVDRCPGCAQSVEFSVRISELLAPESQTAPPSEFRLATGDVALRCRPLIGRDLLDTAAQNASEPTEAGKQLLAKTILAAKRRRIQVDPASLPDEIWEALAARLSEADPSAEILFDLRCPECQKRWDSLLEPADYLWRELANAAQRLLYQTHLLAAAYGWSEDTVLALSPERRAAYINLIQSDGATAQPAFPAARGSTWQ